MNTDDLEVEYVWTGRESVIDPGPAGVRITYKPSQESVECREHDKRLQNHVTAMEDLRRLIGKTMDEHFEIWLQTYIDSMTRYHPELLLNGTYSTKDFLYDAFSAGWDYRRMLEQ